MELAALDSSRKAELPAELSRAVENGWRVFPVKPQGKEPLVKWRAAASADPVRIAAWTREFPGCNWGLATGSASQLVVIDVDGEQWMKDYAALGLPATLTVKSGRGWHFYFRLPAGIDVPGPVKFIAPDVKIDARGTGFFVVYPPSIHPSGARYAFQPGGEPAEAPPELLARLRKPERATVAAPDLGGAPRPEAPAREREYARKALADECAKFKALPSGMGVRNTALNTAAFNIASMVGAGWRDEGEAWAALWEAAADYRAKHGDAKTRATMRSGWRAGLARPRGPLPERVSAPLASGGTAGPAPMHNEAFYGIAGEFVRLMEPFTEADPHAVLMIFLAAAGCMIGRESYHALADGNLHFTNLFLTVAGESAKARKGTAVGVVRNFLARVDPELFAQRESSGIQSGEALVWAVRDARKEGDEEDRGVSDKRLLVVEEEFAHTLEVKRRSGSTLSHTLREAFDGRCLRSTSKKLAASCQEPHISYIGNVTAGELRGCIADTDMTNGFLNRFLFCYARRSKYLPRCKERPDPARLAALVSRLKEALAFARKGGEVSWSDEAGAEWDTIYRALGEGEPGESEMKAALTARAESLCIRLSMIFALLDCSRVIRVEHLHAAIAGWEYSRDSVEAIFGGESGATLSKEAKNILAALREGEKSRTEINKLFHGHVKAEKLDAILGSLERAGHTVTRQEETSGPPRVWYRLAEAA